MTIILVITIMNCHGQIDPGIMGYAGCSHSRHEIVMPSQEICESVVKVNTNAECWIKLTK